MKLSGNAKVLQAATHELSRQWQQTRESWKDQKSQEFEEEYLADLFASVERTCAILEELDRLITTARRDCE